MIRERADPWLPGVRGWLVRLEKGESLGMMGQFCILIAMVVR